MQLNMKLPSIFLLAAGVQQACSLTLDVTDPSKPNHDAHHDESSAN